MIPVAIAAAFIPISVLLLLWLWPTRSSRAMGTQQVAEARIELPQASPTETAPPPVTTTAPRENEAFITMRVKQVYAENASRLYYPEGCSNRPEKAYKIARSLAIKQGFKLAPRCSE